MVHHSPFPKAPAEDVCALQRLRHPLGALCGLPEELLFAGNHGRGTPHEDSDVSRPDFEALRRVLLVPLEHAVPLADDCVVPNAHGHPWMDAGDVRGLFPDFLHVADVAIAEGAVELCVAREHAWAFLQMRQAHAIPDFHGLLVVALLGQSFLLLRQISDHLVQKGIRQLALFRRPSLQALLHSVGSCRSFHVHHLLLVLRLGESRVFRGSWLVLGLQRQLRGRAFLRRVGFGALKFSHEFIEQRIRRRGIVRSPLRSRLAFSFIVARRSQRSDRSSVNRRVRQPRRLRKRAGGQACLRSGCGRRTSRVLEAVRPIREAEAEQRCFQPRHLAHVLCHCLAELS
mmetsp:Transcript_15809/g.60201  ORF Transcript_15809/g.60201 Transcript_15809/m.60201 type:complete len:343 (+) Transcript_15809:993-2021(+)